MSEREFETMMKQYERLVYSVCRQLVHDRHAAEDLAQETFLAAWTHPESCPEDLESQRPWLCRIAVNKAKDHLKSAYSRRMTASEAPQDTLCAMEQAMQAVSLEESCETKDAAGRVRGEIIGMAEPYRTVCTLHFLQQWSAEEIAQRLRRPQKTVNTQLYRAKKAIRANLACCAS